MHQFVVSFTVPPDRREDFVRAAHRAARDSLANEPGSLRFEVIVDESKPDIVYLHEAYADSAAFEAHAAGPYFGAFFAEAGAFSEGPTWLARGDRLEDPATTR